MFDNLLNIIYEFILMYFIITASNEFISKQFKSKICNLLNFRRITKEEPPIIETLCKYFKDDDLIYNTYDNSKNIFEEIIEYLNPYKLCNQKYNENRYEAEMFICLVFDIILLYLINIYFIETYIKKNKKYIYNNNFYLINLRVFCFLILKMIIYFILDIFS